MRKTKIICTIGPASSDNETLRKLILAGMNVARLNFSHGSHENKKELLDRLNKARHELNVPLAILADTKGPEIRLGSFPNGPVALKTGQTFTLTTVKCDGGETRAYIDYEKLPEDISIGTRMLLNDGLVELRVESKTGTEIICNVVSGGEVSSRKGVNLPGVKLNLPYISSKDRADLRFIAENKFSYVAASFVRTASDVYKIREELMRVGGGNIGIIAKIENSEGVNNIDAIMDAADGIMVARGDLGVEVPIEELPVLQKELIKNAYQRGMPVITATEMLESMITKPRPTRAETSDVANAVYDGSSAVMLSGETAIGENPVEACVFMAHIAERAEKDIDYIKRFYTREYARESTVTNAVARAAVTTAHDLNSAAILTMTKGGQTARHISKFRPERKIIACTPSEETYHQLSLIWGVHPVMVPECDTADELTLASTEAAIKTKLLRDGDITVITAGLPLGRTGATNLLRVHVVGDPLGE